MMSNPTNNNPNNNDSTNNMNINININNSNNNVANTPFNPYPSNALMSQLQAYTKLPLPAVKEEEDEGTFSRSNRNTRSESDPVVRKPEGINPLKWGRLILGSDSIMDNDNFPHSPRKTRSASEGVVNFPPIVSGRTSRGSEIGTHSVGNDNIDYTPQQSEREESSKNKEETANTHNITNNTTIHETNILSPQLSPRTPQISPRTPTSTLNDSAIIVSGGMRVLGSIANEIVDSGELTPNTSVQETLIQIREIGSDLFKRAKEYLTRGIDENSLGSLQAYSTRLAERLYVLEGIMTHKKEELSTVRIPDLQRPRRFRKPSKEEVKSNPRKPHISCSSCGTTSSPEWRRGPQGPNSLCNACGLHYAKLEKRKRAKLDGDSGKLSEGEMIDNSPLTPTINSPSLPTAISSLNISSDIGMTSPPSTPLQRSLSFSNTTSPSSQFTIPLSPRSSNYNTSTTNYSNAPRSPYNTSSTTTSSGFKFTPPVNFQYFNSPSQSYTFSNIPLQSNTVPINSNAGMSQMYPQRIPLLNNLQSVSTSHTPPSLSPRPSLTTGSASNATSPRGNSPDQSPREKEAMQTTPRKKEGNKLVPSINWSLNQTTTTPTPSQSETTPLSNDENLVISDDNGEVTPKRMDISKMLN